MSVRPNIRLSGFWGNAIFSVVIQDRGPIFFVCIYSKKVLSVGLSVLRYLWILSSLFLLLSQCLKASVKGHSIVC